MTVGLGIGLFTYKMMCLMIGAIIVYYVIKNNDL